MSADDVEKVEVQCCYAGCVAKGTHRIVLVLLNVGASVRLREPVTQKRDLDPHRRCAGHVHDRDVEALIKGFGWSLEAVRNQLAMGFERAAKLKFGSQHGANVFPDWRRTTVHYVPEGDDITIIPVMVETPGGLEQTGTAKVYH